MQFVWDKIILNYEKAYPSRANKGRAYYSKIIVLSLRLSHKKQMINVFYHDFLEGVANDWKWPLLAQVRYT